MKVKHKDLVQIVISIMFLLMIISMIDYYKPEWAYPNQNKAGFKCVYHNQTDITMSGKNSVVCDIGKTCYGFIKNDCEAILTVEEQGNKTTIDMELMERAVCHPSQYCVMFTESDCISQFTVFEECLISEAVVDNETIVCNGTVESCELEYNRRKEV